MHLTNTTLFGTKELEINYGCKDIESELFLETFFNLEKMNRKIDNAFCKSSLKERVATEKNIISNRFIQMDTHAHSFLKKI